MINDNLIWFIYNLYNLSSGCYNGAFEVFGGLQNYMNWTNNPTFVFSNFIANFGFIYTIVRDLILFFMSDQRTIIKTGFKLG